ncbi:MAG: LLM class flavin-dependent oxidoreductase [Herpetosiphonaceae bacterium]|nr:LLM class flavin-dependent oxidoreductase [Herpetosiphonaceae bacterium]
MKFAIDIPCFGLPGSSGNDFGDPHYVAELAYEAEQAGWDGFFVWDHMGANWPVAVSDPWILLAAIAMRTKHIKLGPMVTPIPRRRPWKLARETVTIDRLSEGRLILGVGIGGGSEYSAFSEPGDDRQHGEMLDEGLAVLKGLWSGAPFSYQGRYYQVSDVHFMPAPVQAQIPVWVAGFWPNKRPFRRAAAWQGAFPLGKDLSLVEQMAPEGIREVAQYIAEQRTANALTEPYDLVQCGLTDGTDPAADAALLDEYAAAGATWWLENLTNERGSMEDQRARIRKGPPRL